MGVDDGISTHRTMKNLYRALNMTYILRFAAAMAALLLASHAALALAPDYYAGQSRLAKGTWVRVSVSRSGMHHIPEATLRGWGFSDPSRVKVFGYGARRLPELLGAGYLDDLPQTASEYVASKGVYFYAEGPVRFNESTSGYFVPAQNPFSSLGYYYLSDSVDDEERLTPSSLQYEGAIPADDRIAKYFMDRTWHEVDAVSPGEAGFLLLGEDFRTRASQSFTLSLPGYTPAEPVRMEVAFMAKSLTGVSTLQISADGTALPVSSTDRIAKVTDKYSHGTLTQTRKQFDLAEGDNALVVGIDYSCQGTVISANLDYIAVNYPRRMAVPAEGLTVYTSDMDACRLESSGADTRVWAVTDPLQASAPRVKAVDGALLFFPSARDAQTYVAWNPSGSFPAPAFVEKVRNQNLHASEVVDMVIFTPNEWKAQAERLAELHRTDPSDPLTVAVISPQELYNEFSSGVPDVQAQRKFLKMMYDRGTDAASGARLRYALVFSRVTYDYRRLTDRIRALGYPMLPAWFTDRGLNDNDSYTTDDILGFLEDNSGVNVGRDQLCIAVGRLPVTTVTEAKNAVDKITRYMQKPNYGQWRNVVMLVADDQDNGVHMTDAERQWRAMNAAQAGKDAFYKKLYTDEFELVGGIYEDARTQFYRNLDEGVMWWSYQGHANPAMLTAEGLVTYRDLNELYLRNLPIVFAATCDFMRWDSATTSGAEILFKNANGGVAAAISATRPVYIADNGYLCESTGRELFTRNDDGSIRTLGEVYRMGKNRYRYNNGTAVSNTNKLRYVLLGDPAMRLAMPSIRMELTHVGDKEVLPLDQTDSPVELMARQQTTMRGRVVDAAGQPVTDFNGTVTVTLYDAEKSVTTRGNGDEGRPVTFDQQGTRLFVGSDAVKNGEFTLKVAMPAEVTDNYRPAAVNLYAYADDGREAASVCRDLYVYGTDPDAEEDNIPPVIESAYLNHPSFRDGQQVNSAPMLIATVTDDRAINLSTAGVGHQMAVYLDEGSKTFTDVADYFVPFADGRPGGSIAYPMSNLSVGWHQLRLRVWDTAPNSAEAIINFEVAKEIAPVLYDVYTSENPVSTEANFYISHDRPDGNLTVTIEVFDLMGRKVWEATEEGRSDMFTSMPLTWDLRDSGGRRVARGIYLYRATVTDKDSGRQSATASRKLAVRAGS